MSPAALAAVLRGTRYDLTSEERLHEGLKARMQAAGLAFEHEVRLGPQDRIDFLLDDGLGIEVKVDGSTSAVTRQIHRYTQHERISALLLVTARTRHAALPAEMNGKPVHVLVLLGSLL